MTIVKNNCLGLRAEGRSHIPISERRELFKPNANENCPRGCQSRRKIITWHKCRISTKNSY